MAQHQSQPVVQFNALKPATWGSLKLLPLALRSKLTGAKGPDDLNRVAFGKENAGGQHVGLQGPPKLGDLSHLQAIGPRRSVNQRYVLQPNLSVSRPAVATHAPGLSGLLLPGVTPIATQYSKQQQQQRENAATQSQTQQHSTTPLRQRSSTPQQQRSGTPSSPSLRGRQPQANPNFGPPASNISTRLPTPVRINASPGPSPSPTSIALTIPKPPSPSRSLSQSGAAPLPNPFASASACSSPAASTSTSNTFLLPTPPSILANGPPPRASRGGAAAAAVPWASAATAHTVAGQGTAASSHTPTSVRPSPPPPERSILASIQLPSNQQQQPLRGAPAAAVPGHSEKLAPVVAPAPMLAGAAAAGVSPVLSAPAIQAALQQALQGAVERKPETFGRVVDNFEHFFDSLMHPGDPGKLDGLLPHELPEELRYGDGWYRHCRDRRNIFDQPATPCSAPAAAGHESSTPFGRRFSSTPFAEPLDNDAAPFHDQARAVQQQLQAQQLQKPAWSMEEPPLSDACVKALEVAHHGLRKVLTPTARSRSASDCTAGTVAQRGGGTAGAPSLLELAEMRLLRAQAAMAGEGELDDTAASRPRLVAACPEVAQTAAALTCALESLARDPATAAEVAAVAVTEDVRSSSPQRCLAAALAMVESVSATPLSAPVTEVAVTAEVELASPKAADAAAVEEPLAVGDPDGIEVSASPVRLPGRPPVGSRRFTVPALLIRSLEAPLRPNAAGAALSPPPDSARPNGPDSARPPSTAATTPGPKTPGGGACDSVATTAATTPVGRGSATALTTPKTATAAETTTTQELDVAAAPCMAAAVERLPEAGSAAAAPLRSLSRELAAAERSEEAALPKAPVPVEPAVAAVEASSPAMPPAVLWSPAFPPVAPAAVMARGAAAVAGALPQQRPPSPVTLLQNAPRDMPTPNPAFFSSAAAAAPAAGATSLAAAVAAVAAPSQATGAAAQSGTGQASAAADPLKEIVVGIEKLSTLKQNILAEDKEVDVASITQMIQLKLAVEQLLARTSTAMKQDTPAAGQPAATAAASEVPPPPQAAPAAQTAATAHAEQAVPAAAATPKKHSRSATFGAFLKSVFSPRSGSASKAQQAAPTASAVMPAPLPPSSASGRLGATTTTRGSILSGAPNCVNVAVEDVRAVPASPVATAVGVRVPRPMSASALPRQAASPSVTDRGRYAALHQRAAARLAEAAAEPAASRPSPVVKAATGAQVQGQVGPQGQRGAVWQRYEEKIAMHRQQLDTTKSQLDEAVRKLNDMQTEFDELLLCLGMESAKNKALCDAMRAAGLDPEPILAAIEEQWMSGAMQ